ncbi:MAG: hypothetical protein KGZ83_00940 [Sulfuricella sp.]|nr:hypothetical protein [Sulfuricella sp.]
MNKPVLIKKGMLLGAVVGMLSLSGCAAIRTNSLDTLLKHNPPDTCIGPDKLYKNGNEGAELNLEAYLAANRGASAGTKLDGFLDCTVADLHGAGDELKTYRGYVALAVISRYAAFNYSGLIGGYADLNFQSYDGIQDDAMSTLARLDFADRMLRQGSGIPNVANTVTPADLAGNPTLTYMQHIGDPKKLPDVEKLQRAMSVLMVAGSAEKPTLNRAKNWFSTVISAIGGGLVNPESLVDQGLKVVGKSLTLKSFGNAYLDDARKELEGMKNQTGRPNEADWNYWANVIKDSCAAIAATAGATSHCAGGWMTNSKAAPAGVGK